ncbi:unnamed protein product [Pseudo-nitzschia multistriata]|uniref:Uncharacterized protein n=1 Tax=Pseudo-nitzschia multistriata TaxID=183589 RepID=A0A448ZB44_9STRA|nr:unnamed protein product [Pseudo-nitzschia multistriata]
MIRATHDEGDTDYDGFSSVSLRSSDRNNVGEADDKFPTFDDNGSLLGVIVDRSSFDEDDELTVYRDGPSVVHNRHLSSLSLSKYHQQYIMESAGPLGGVVMKNGKVRRKMRWKPRFGKKKASNFSSNASVISALTNRSSSTSRSSSTTRSFLSHFSRKSNTSFHTFHSTETPVATNKANRPTAPHTVLRPNYQDSFDTKRNSAHVTKQPKHATIETEGNYVNYHSRLGGSAQSVVSSSSGFPSTRLDSVQESASPYEQSQEEVEVNRSPTLSDSDRVSHNPIPGPATAIEAINVISGGSNNSVGARSMRSSTSKGSSQKPPMSTSPKNSKAALQQQSKPRRPPLFKRRLGKNRNKSSGSNSSINSGNSSTIMIPSSTDTHSTAALSPLSLERENSGIPILVGDEEDRCVTITSFSSGKNSTEKNLTKESIVEIDGEESSLSPTVQSSLSGSHSGGGLSVQSGSSAVGNGTSAPESMQKRVASTKKKPPPSLASTVVRTNSPNTPPLPGGATKIVARKQYNRPLDSTNTTGVTSANSKGKLLGGPRNKSTSVPCDLDEGAFLEAEHNLRAIHEMAAEHLAHGEYEEAADVFEEILRGQQQRYGQDHYRVGTALHNLGIVYLKKKDYLKAIEICQRAVDVRKDSLVPNHPDVAVSLAQLGVAHLESENYHEALAAFRDALHIRRNFLGPRHTKCSKILNNIGCALYSIEDFAGAKRAFDEALDIQREALRNLPPTEGADGHRP